MLSPIRIPVWEEYVSGGKGSVAYCNDSIAIGDLLGGHSFMMSGPQYHIVDRHGIKHFPGEIVWIAGQVPEHLR